MTRQLFGGPRAKLLVLCVFRVWPALPLPLAGGQLRARPVWGEPGGVLTFVTLGYKGGGPLCKVSILRGLILLGSAAGGVRRQQVSCSGQDANGCNSDALRAFCSGRVEPRRL